MDHWFDRLAKAIAQRNLNRRDLVDSAIKAGVAVIGAPLLTRSEALASIVSGARETQTSANTCVSRREGRSQVFDVSASSTFGGRVLTYNQTVRQTSRTGVEVNETIRLGGNTLFQMNVSRTGSSTRVNITYGDGFQGIRQGTFTSTDGQTVQGNVDGNRVVPFQRGTDPRSIRFADAGRAPTLRIADETRNAIKSITDLARQNASRCTARRAAPVPRRNRDARQRPFSLDLGDHPSVDANASKSALVQGDSGHDSYPDQSAGCLSCKGSCTASGIGCGVGTAIGCAFTFGIGCAVGIAGCGVAIPACFLGCHASGAPCCPETCGGIACCEKNETCLDVNRGVCCSPNLKPCSNKSCCTQTDTCIDATGVCCPGGQTICNDKCCKKGEVCKDGVACCPPAQETCGTVCCGPNEVCVGNKKCCPKNSACGNVCCDELSRCANVSSSLCCSFASVTCGSTCCKPGQQCINGKCCAIPCGNVCCSSGQACQNPTTSTCVSSNCRPGTATCVSQQGPGKLGRSQCCPPNVQCCLGKCCARGEICCSGGGTPFGCHLPGVCVH